MAFRVSVSEEARNDILKASSWYESEQKGLGGRFLLIIGRQIKYLSNFPEAFPMKKDNFRELVVNEFPYVIIYTFQDNLIRIFAVFNTSRNPTKKP